MATRANSTWKDLKDEIEALGVTDETVISKIDYSREDRFFSGIHQKRETGVIEASIENGEYTLIND